MLDCICPYISKVPSLILSWFFCTAWLKALAGYNMSTVGLRKLETMISWLSSTHTWVSCASLPTDSRFLDALSVIRISLLRVESRLFISPYTSLYIPPKKTKVCHRCPSCEDETLVGQLESHQWNAYGARDLPLSISLRLQHASPLFGVYGPGAPPGR